MSTATYLWKILNVHPCFQYRDGDRRIFRKTPCNCHPSSIIRQWNVNRAAERDQHTRCLHRWQRSHILEFHPRHFPPRQGQHEPTWLSNLSAIGWKKAVIGRRASEWYRRCDYEGAAQGFECADKDHLQLTYLGNGMRALDKGKGSRLVLNSGLLSKNSWVIP